MMQMIRESETQKGRGREWKRVGIERKGRGRRFERRGKNRYVKSGIKSNKKASSLSWDNLLPESRTFYPLWIPSRHFFLPFLFPLFFLPFSSPIALFHTAEVWDQSSNHHHRDDRLPLSPKPRFKATFHHGNRRHLSFLPRRLASLAFSLFSLSFSLLLSLYLLSFIPFDDSKIYPFHAYTHMARYTKNSQSIRTCRPPTNLDLSWHFTYSYIDSSLSFFHSLSHSFSKRLCNYERNFHD